MQKYDDPLKKSNEDEPKTPLLVIYLLEKEHKIYENVMCTPKTPLWKEAINSENQIYYSKLLPVDLLR